jgi:SRSO17 transposase
MVTPRRTPITTVAFVDDYCQQYQHLFDQVRNYEAFKFLHLGMLSEIKPKSLPAIARAVGLEDSQQLHQTRARFSLESSNTKTNKIVVNPTLYRGQGNRLVYR